MAGDQATNITPRQVGVLMLRIKSRAIKQAIAAASPKTPAQTEQELQKLVTRNLRLQKWMKVSGTSVRDLGRMVYNGK